MTKFIKIKNFSIIFLNSLFWIKAKLLIINVINKAQEVCICKPPDYQIFSPFIG